MTLHWRRLLLKDKKYAITLPYIFKFKVAAKVSTCMAHAAAYLQVIRISGMLLLGCAVKHAIQQLNSGVLLRFNSEASTSYVRPNVFLLSDEFHLHGCTILKCAPAPPSFLVEHVLCNRASVMSRIVCLSVLYLCRKSMPKVSKVS